MRVSLRVTALAVAGLLAVAAGAQEAEKKEKKGLFARLKAGSQPAPAEGNVVLLTTETVGRPYELVTAFPAIGMEEWGGSSGVPPGGGLTDPGLTSITRALTSLQSIAEKNGADAVIGVRIDFEGPIGSEEGRAIAYGTLIRYVEAPAESAEQGETGEE